MRSYFFVLKCLLIFFPSTLLHAQDESEMMKVMFYNVENLFDIEDDSLKNDGEFMPEGSKQWNRYRYEDKLKKIYKTIIAVGQWMPPVIVGLAEIENRKVMEDLVYQTPLEKFGYRIVHEESGDGRGIDVALLYRKEYFQYLHHTVSKVPLQRPTRDILIVSGVMAEDTCHFIVNHWPSRWGGKLQSEGLRITAAGQLRLAIDSLAKLYCEPRIVVMGDFNDDPDDLSLKLISHQAYGDKCQKAFQMINLMEDMDKPGLDEGTLVYVDVFRNWFMFDQVLVSQPLLKGKGLSLPGNNAHIFKEEWLLDEHGKPKRTYLGDYYLGGFSDHLPVYIGLVKAPKQKR